MKSILPISIGQPAPSSFILRQQQETLQRLQQQNQLHQQQIDSFNARYSNMPNPISIRSQSPFNANLLTMPRNSNDTQPPQFEQQNYNMISNNIRSATPQNQRQQTILNRPYTLPSGQQQQQQQTISETAHFITSQNANKQSSNSAYNFANYTPPIVPVTYSDQSGTQAQLQISPNYQNVQNRQVFSVGQQIQEYETVPPMIEQSIQMYEMPQRDSPHSLRIEQGYTQQIPQGQNPSLFIASPEMNKPQFGAQINSSNGYQIIQDFQHDRSSFHIQPEDNTLYIPIENVRTQQIQQNQPVQQQHFSLVVNKQGVQDNGAQQQPLFPPNPSKSYFTNVNKRQQNVQNDKTPKFQAEELNKENKILYKSTLPDPLKSYSNKSEQFVSKEEFQKMKEKFQQEVQELQAWNQKLQNEIKMKDIDLDTQKSQGEEITKKNQRLEGRIKELENMIENLKEEQEKIVEVCEKKDVEVEEQNLQLADKQIEVSRWKQQIESMQEKYTNMQEKLQLYEDTQEELQNQIQKNIHLDQRNTHFNSEIQNLKQIIIDLEQQMKQLQGQLPPIPYKQIEQETLQMQQYIQNLEQRLLIVSHEKNDEITHWRQMAEIDTVRVYQEMENRIKFLATENERLNQIIVGRCVDMRQNW